MNDNEINIAIAQACGWHRIIKDDEWGPDRALKPDQKFEPGCAFTNIPDYCNDLNAMHEAEKSLTDEQHCVFRSLLFASAYNSGACKTNLDAERLRVSATARQRAEAFLRTLGKWKD